MKFRKCWQRLAAAVAGDLAILAAVVAGTWIAGPGGAITAAAAAGIAVYILYRRQSYGNKPPSPYDFHLDGDK